jgi:hypothetical protein
MTTIDRSGRVILSCDHCPVRMDLGPEQAVRARNRMPSGWVNLGSDRHFCTSCAQNISFVSQARAAQHGPRLAA